MAKRTTPMRPMSQGERIRYEEAAHQMQTGVLMRMEIEAAEGKFNDLTAHASAKHLRAGVNSSMVETSVLAQLMFRKGLITEDEYYEALIHQMKLEAKSYQDWLEAKLGRPVTLG